jgi:capsular polysaccharide biosynthesis protein
VALLKILKRVIPRLFGPMPRKQTLHLRVEPELTLLPPILSVTETINAPVLAPGAVSRISPPRHILEAGLVQQLDGRIGGSDQPLWADGTGGAPEFGVCLCRVKDALYTPEFGAVITADGAALHSSVAEALYFTKDLSAFPNVKMVGDKAVMSLPATIRSFEKASIFMAWGGRYNYGHFVLDCLSALCAIAEEGLLAKFPPIAPTLTPWHRELLHLMLGDEASDIVEVEDDIVRIHDTLFATPMDHFLHAPSTPIEKVRSRILARLPNRDPGPQRIYLSRRDDAKRPLLNEDELEKRLRDLGFEVIHPQALSVVEQILLFKDASIVVGATGAAFANCLFCPPGAKVFEIQPSNYTGIWTRGLCHQVNIDWFGYFAPSPEESDAAGVEVARRPGAMFAWRLALDDFMDFLAKGLKAPPAPSTTPAVD